jgi:uncharacterized membrane protein YfcA
MTTVELVVAGVTVGLMLGLLGGGGAIFTAPLLIYGFGLDALEATTVSLVVVLLGALSGLVGHAREHAVKWRKGTIFGLVGVAGAVAGSWLAGAVPERVLLGGFSVLLLLAALAMWRPPVRSGPAQDGPTQSVPLVVLTALSVGVVTGFFGVGGGFVIVPAMVLVLGCTMRHAAATGLLVIAINAGAALLARGATSLDLGVVLPMAIGAATGAFIGSRLASRVPTRRLQKAFAGLMVATAVLIGAQTVSV